MSSQDVLSRNGVVITEEIGEWHALSARHKVPVQEVGLIDFNRTGVCLDDEDVRIGFRTRFNGSLLYPNDLSWYALPVRSPTDSHFHIKEGRIYFKNHQIGVIDRPVLDTCDTSYQRGRHLLNLNSRSRSNCAGCQACVHNDKSLYDGTVIKDQHELRTKSDIAQFFSDREKLGLRISELDQIAVVTGLFSDKTEALGHLQDVYSVATAYGFKGELMYFGCQIASFSALEEFAKLGHPAIIFAIDNFTKRSNKLSRTKSALSLEELYGTMSIAKQHGIETTFAYIAGVDSLQAVRDNFNRFADVCTRFPVINIFQIQTDLQARALHPEAKSLDYYLQARLAIEQVFKNRKMRPRRWENYRPLWYRQFADELLDVRPYG